jgi:kinetochore protein Mis12/MTW1
MLTATL